MPVMRSRHVSTSTTGTNVAVSIRYRLAAGVTYGVSPAIGSDAPFGIAVVRAAGGRVPRRSADAAGTWVRSQPPSAAAPMASTPNAPAARNWRRPIPPGGVGAGRRADRSSRSSVTALPAAAPSTPLTTDDGRAASGSNAAATMPTTANEANPTTTPTRERRPRSPSAAPHANATTTIPINSAFLSRSPNVRMAKPASGPASHTTRRDAIAPTNDGRVRSMTAAASSTAPSAHPAPTTPAHAAATTPTERAGSAGPGPPPVATHPSEHACRRRPMRSMMTAC